MLLSFFRAPPPHSARGAAAMLSTSPWCEPTGNRGSPHRWIHPCTFHRGPRHQLQHWKDLLYLIALLWKECHSQREFQCLGAKRKDCFGCFELSVGSLHVRVLCLGFPLVGSLRACWSLPADLPGSTAIVEWVSHNFERVWNLAEFFYLWNNEVVPTGRSWRPARYSWYKIG